MKLFASLMPIDFAAILLAGSLYTKSSCAKDTLHSKMQDIIMMILIKKLFDKLRNV